MCFWTFDEANNNAVFHNRSCDESDADCQPTILATYANAIHEESDVKSARGPRLGMPRTEFLTF